MESVENVAKAWIEHDPNPTTAKYVEKLLSSSMDEDKKELHSLFPIDGRRIGFGTAGLRSAMKPGPLGMNDLVIIQTAQGLARYCQESAGEKKLRVVIGYDHRANPSLDISSQSFALYSVLALEAAGMETILLDGFVHTPLVAFSTIELEACCGIMITASHNPKDDAGYKVYWKDGCQIRPPIDQGIAAAILRNTTPWINYGSLLETLCKTHMDTCAGLSSPSMTRQLTAAYFNAIAKSGLVTGQAKLPWTCLTRPPPSFCYTAMHGVGREVASKVFEVFGLPPFYSVAAQELPDPAFSTVAFPNPEERGALKMAKDVAEEKGCDIVLANDPDADRFAICEKNRDTGEWTAFTGDEIGVMLGQWLWSQVGIHSDKPVVMCASTVSSKMLAEIARVEGFRFEETLTGFKWIGSRAETLSREEGYRALFCYEEAIGFCCGDVIFDKDGITAMGVFAELAYHVYRNGMRLKQHMQSLYDKYGEFVSNNGYYFCHDPEVAKRIMDNIPNDMSSVGPYKVKSIRNLGEPGYDSSTPDKRPTLPTSASSPMITICFENGCVAQFRASGTEPKFKYYIELKGEPGVSRDVVTTELMKMSQVLLETLLRPDENGLIKPD